MSLFNSWTNYLLVTSEIAPTLVNWLLSTSFSVPEREHTDRAIMFTLNGDGWRTRGRAARSTVNLSPAPFPDPTRTYTHTHEGLVS